MRFTTISKTCIMKKIFALLILAACCLCASAQYNSTNLSLPEGNTEGYTFKHLCIYPVMASGQFLEAFKNVGKFLTLTEALESGKVVITEAVDSSRQASGRNINVQTEQVQQSYPGERVNQLFIENTSEDTVLVLAGEVVKGGKQDRMIAQNFLLPPQSGKKDLSVFCVEHGRWNYGEGLAVQTVKFKAESHYSSARMRKAAIVNKSQQDVWNEVDNVTTKNDASTSSQTYTALKASDKFTERLDEYLAFFTTAIGQQHNVIGLLACSGDKVIGCDLFATPELFRGQMKNLLQSYSTEAITNGSDPKVSKQQAQKFLDEFLSDENTQKEVVTKSGSILENAGRKLVIQKF